MEKVTDRGAETFAALLFGLHRAERTGILELAHERSWRKLYLVDGVPVMYESSLDGERLSKTLVKADIVSEKPLTKIINSLQPGENLEARLVADGVVGPEELRAHKRTNLERHTAVGLEWSQFDYRFSDHRLISGRIDDALLPAVKPLRALWFAVKQHVSMDWALPFVTDPEAGNIRASDGLADILEAMEVEAPFDRLSEALEAGEKSFEDLFGALNDKSGHLAPLVWLLEAVGAVTRSTREQEPVCSQLCDGNDIPGEVPLHGTSELSESDTVTSPPPRASRTRAKTPQRRPSPRDAAARNRTANHLPDLLATARNHRAGKDYYGFFDLSSDAGQDEIKEAYERNTKLWRSALSTEGLPESGKADAEALIDAADRVWDTLKTKKKRKSYNSKLGAGLRDEVIALAEQSNASGSAPLEPSKDDAEVETKLRTAEEFIANSRYDEALQFLNNLRVSHPADPRVLASLGWVNFQVHGSEDDAAEEFLQLALTFDPTNAPALEYLGRIAQAKGDPERALEFASRVQKIDPTNAWAEESRAEVSTSNKKKKRGFWRRGG